MSTTTIRFAFNVNGAPADATTVVLRDPTAAFGVRRTDTLATVVAAGTAMTHDTTGVYSHTFTDPAAELLYNYWVEAVYAGATYRFERNLSGPPAGAARSYLSVGEADTLAATLPEMEAWEAGTADEKSRALERASLDVDNAMPYQGRKYAVDQLAAFPRIAFDDAASRFSTPTAAAVVWDWDDSADAAVVPDDVVTAVLLQADTILSGDREARLSAQHDGVVYDLTADLAESYRQTRGPGVATGLCRAAWLLMRKYRLRSGRLL